MSKGDIMGEMPKYDNAIDAFGNFSIGDATGRLGAYLPIRSCSNPPCCELSHSQTHYLCSWHKLFLHGYIHKDTELGQAITDAIQPYTMANTHTQSSRDLSDLHVLILNGILRSIDTHQILGWLSNALARSYSDGRYAVQRAIRKDLGI